MKHLLLFAACLLAASSGYGQTTDGSALLAFDVAAIRPSRPDAPQHTNVPLDAGNVYSAVSAEDARGPAGGLFIATHQALWRYISFAYKLSGTQELALRFSVFSGVPKSGAPTWVTGSFNGAPEFFDISARAPANSSIDQMRLMMQTLLAERFHLAAHYITAETPVFALVLSKPGVAGSDLKPHPASDTCASPTSSQTSADGSHQAAVAPSAIENLPPICGIIAHVLSDQPGQHFGGRAVPLSLLATSLPTMTGLAAMPRPVIDQTGLTGLYDFTLTWVHDSTPEDGAVSDNIANFRSALKNQLGITLKPSQAPIRFLIVDHVEHPSAN